jgi:hypothetical protein
MHSPGSSTHSSPAVLVGLAHRVRIAARFHRQVGPVGDRHVEDIGRPPQPARGGNGLTRGRAGADLRPGVGGRNAPIRRKLHLGETGLRPRTEPPLDAAETHPIIFSGMLRVVDLLARGAAGPQRMRARLLQHGLGALRAVRDRALGVLHPGLQHVAQTELDGIEAKLASDLVHHQLGRRQGFQRAVAARRAAVDGA